MVANVRPRLTNKPTVAVGQALENNTWMNDIQYGLTMIGFMEFFRLFDCLSEVRLSEGGINMFGNLMLQEITQLNRHTKRISMVSDF